MPLVVIRKPGLIPGTVISRSFVKEYGNGVYEMRQGAIQENQPVLVAYDILAAQGAARAAFDLIEIQGGSVAGAAYLAELDFLGARAELAGYHLTSLVHIEKDPAA